MNKHLSFFIAVILFLFQSQIACGDALDATSEADASRIASVLKPGDILVELCRTCNTYGLREGELTARKIVSVNAVPREKPLWYFEDYPYHVIVTQDLFFSANQISESKDRKEITATGTCMVPENVDTNFGDQGCYGFIGDSNEPHAYRCKGAVSLNYTYFQRTGLWQNLATISQDNTEAVRWRDTVKLSDSTWNKIRQCRKSYEESLLKKTTASGEHSNIATLTPPVPAPPPHVPSGRPKVYEEVYSVCRPAVPVGHRDFSLTNNVGPSTPILGYFMSRGQEFDIKTWQVTLVDGPKHGVRKGAMYYPNDGYLGPDQMTYVVDAQGKKFKVIETVWVANTAPEYGGCPEGYKLPAAE